MASPHPCNLVNRLPSLESSLRNQLSAGLPVDHAAPQATHAEGLAGIVATAIDLVVASKGGFVFHGKFSGGPWVVSPAPVRTRDKTPGVDVLSYNAQQKSKVH